MKKIIIHSGQGVHYKTNKYKITCEEMGLIPSISRKTTPTDNRQVENIFSCLVKEKLSRNKYKNTKELAQAINDYFTFCNNSRVHTRLGMTPRENFELKK